MSIHYNVTLCYVTLAWFHACSAFTATLLGFGLITGTPFLAQRCSAYCFVADWLQNTTPNSSLTAVCGCHAHTWLSDWCLMSPSNRWLCNIIPISRFWLLGITSAYMHINRYIQILHFLSSPSAIKFYFQAFLQLINHMYFSYKMCWVMYLHMHIWKLQIFSNADMPLSLKQGAHKTHAVSKSSFKLYHHHQILTEIIVVKLWNHFHHTMVTWPGIPEISWNTHEFMA